MAVRITQKTSRARESSRGATSGSLIGAATVLSLGLGIAAPIAGLVLAIVNEAIPGVPTLGRAATILCVSTIPFLLLGSHLMDVIERRRARMLDRENGTGTQE